MDREDKSPSDRDTTVKNKKQQVIMNLKKINNREEYDWAVQRVEELLPLVDDDTPIRDKNSIELERLSNMVADYSDIHFSIESKQ